MRGRAGLSARLSATPSPPKNHGAAGAAFVTPWALASAHSLAGHLPWLRNEFIVVVAFGSLSLVYAGLYVTATRLFERSLKRQLFGRG